MRPRAGPTNNTAGEGGKGLKMSEQLKPADNRRRDPIQAFFAAYDKATDECKTSKAHTDTEGWQQLYSGERKAEAESRRNLSKDLARLSVQMDETGLGEDAEKEMGEIKKASAALRARVDAFDLITVGPVRRAVTDAEKIIEEARNRARRDEQDAPLINVGLVELMRDAINGVTKFRWNPQTGRIETFVTIGTDDVGA